MIEILTNLAIFLGAILLIVAGLIGVVWWKTGRSIPAILYYLDKTGDGALRGVLAAIAAVLVFIVAALVFNALLPSRADAAEWVWLEETAIYAGVDYVRDSPQCHSEPYSVNDTLTSNIGVRQSIVRVGDVSTLVNYTHHSCAVGADWQGYDGVGIQFEWRIKR